MKKIIVFGATGTLGWHIVKKALAENFEVSAFARNPFKLEMENENLNLIEGDVLNYSDVEKAIANADAVYFAVGAGSKGTVRAEGTRNVIRAMKKSGVKRLISLSSLGVGDSRENLNFFWKYIMFGLLLRRAYKDHKLQEDLIKQSDLDWTIVRPAAFTDADFTGNYKHGKLKNSDQLNLKISRADVADFMVKQFSNKQYLRLSPGVSN